MFSSPLVQRRSSIHRTNAGNASRVPGDCSSAFRLVPFRSRIAINEHAKGGIAALAALLWSYRRFSFWCSLPLCWPSSCARLQRACPKARRRRQLLEL